MKVVSPVPPTTLPISALAAASSSVIVLDPSSRIEPTALTLVKASSVICPSEKAIVDPSPLPVKVLAPISSELAALIRKVPVASPASKS